MEYQRRKDFERYRSERVLARRLLLIRVLVGLGFASVYAGLWYLQIPHGEEYRSLAEANRVRRIVLWPQRGMMYDRKDRVVVGNRVGFTVVLDREKAHRSEQLARVLSPPLGVPSDVLRERIERYRGRPSYEGAILKEDVTLADVAFVESHRYEFPSLQVATEPKRAYISGPQTAHVVGYVGEASDSQLKADPTLMMGDRIGRTGLERTADGRLRGKRGMELVEVDSLGRRISSIGTGRQPEPGEDIHLTIDLDLQEKLAEALGDEAGGGVFLDVRNGEVLALVSTPAYDPNQFARRFTREQWRSIIEDPRRPLQNRAVQGRYSAGSTFKLFVALAALEAGLIDESTTVHCGGSAVFYGRPFRCWKKGGHGSVALNAAIAQSCNVYFYTIGSRLGIERIAEEARRFGFGSLSGIDLLGEQQGTVASPAWKMATLKQPWYAGETISVSIGQGPTETTIVQMANAAAMMATGGVAYRPQLIRPTRGVPVTPEILRRIEVEPRALSAIRRAMRNVVEAGTGGRTRLPGITVVGKTGTVQVYRASAGVDSEKLPKHQRDHGWFMGYAPMEDPTIAFAVLVEHGGHGGVIAAPIVRKVLEAYFGVPPREEGPAPSPPQPPDRVDIARAQDRQ